jgi:hypothetical protein
MTAPHIPTVYPVQLGKDLLSAEAANTLQQGIKAALIAEALRWTGDARVEVWTALTGAAARMGIEITTTELYELQINTQPRVAPPPHAPAYLWDGTRPTYYITTTAQPTGDDHGQV